MRLRNKNFTDPDVLTDISGFEVLIHFDGGCFPNPGGPGTFGFTISKLDEVGHHGYGNLGSGPGMTNNVAEWCGLRAALQRLIDLKGQIVGDKILIFGDSQLVIRQLTGKWRIKAKHLGVYQMQCLALLSEIGLPWEAKWVPRKENKEADVLAEEGLLLCAGSISPPQFA